MKILKTGIVIFLLLTISNKLISQKNDYLDFLGKKYLLGGWLSTPDIRFSILAAEGSNTKYTFYGNHLLKKRVERFSDGSESFYIKNDSIHFKDTNDKSNKDESHNHMISNVRYEFTDSINLYNLVDSVQIDKLDKEAPFNILWRKKDRRIYGFKIIGDNLEYVIEYSDFNSINNKTDNFARDYLIKIIQENKNCSRFILKDIYFYDYKCRSKHVLMIELLLYR